jgi:hypothetical protein
MPTNSDSAELRELVARINDDPEKAHGDFTPAVRRLIDFGESALAVVLPLMNSTDSDTRIRAQRVLEGVTMASYGFEPGHGWRDQSGEEGWERFWASLGNLDWDLPADRRAEAVERWCAWLAARGRESQP